MKMTRGKSLVNKYSGSISDLSLQMQYMLVESIDLGVFYCFIHLISYF